MAVSRRAGRSRFTLVLLILTSVTLLTLDFRGFAPLDQARSTVLGVFEPVGDFAAGVFEPVGDAWNGAFSYDELEAQNEDLRRQVDELQGQITSGEVAKQSLRQLLEQADIEFVGDIPTVRARVVSGAIANFDRTLEIDRGTSSGIQVGMPVVTGQGLIGVVVRASPERSVVDLLSGGNLKVGFSVVGTNVLGVAQGHGDGRRLTAVVDVDRPVLPGQIVVTSGVQGSTFPQGLPVAMITDVGEDTGTLQRDLELQMLASSSDLSFVTVVLWEPAAP